MYDLNLLILSLEVKMIATFERAKCNTLTTIDFGDERSR
jgi:hypothetical protein